jgi:hypothetical protein
LIYLLPDFNKGNTTGVSGGTGTVYTIGARIKVLIPRLLVGFVLLNL